MEEKMLQGKTVNPTPHFRIEMDSDSSNASV